MQFDRNDAVVGRECPNRSTRRRANRLVTWPRRAARAIAGILAGGLVAGSATLAAAQALPPATAAVTPPTAAAIADLNLYLESSERARQEAALEEASRGPLGVPVNWADPYMKASGRIVALRDYVGFGGAQCRDYQLVVDVPARFAMVWTNRENTYNNSAIARQMPEPLTPAFTRETIVPACHAPASIASAEQGADSIAQGPRRRGSPGRGGRR